MVLLKAFNDPICDIGVVMVLWSSDLCGKQVVVGGGTPWERWVTAKVVRVRKATGCFTVSSLELPSVGFSRTSDTCFGYLSTKARISDSFRIVFDFSTILGGQNG